MPGADRGGPDSRYIPFMRRALRLARRAEGDVGHYPMVGAVIVRRGRVVAEGWFKKPGGPHAEVDALMKAGAGARGSELILNLEPCCHFGRTPPCTEAVIAAGIKKVVAGMKDPNPLVSGKGFRKLRRAGIDVVTGVLEDECRRLNEVFVKHMTYGTPFVTLKAAATLDGRIADRYGGSKWITGRKSRSLVHALRDKVDVVMVGAGTVIADDPRLTARLAGKGRHPRPLVVDSRLRSPLTARVFRTLAQGSAMVATTARAPARKVEAFEAAGVEVIIARRDSRGRVDLKDLMRRLGKRKIASVLLEGGAGLFTSAVESGIVDKMVLFYAPRVLADRESLGMLGGEKSRKIENALRLRDIMVRRSGEDVMVVGYPAR